MPVTGAPGRLLAGYEPTFPSPMSGTSGTLLGQHHGIEVFISFITTLATFSTTSTTLHLGAITIVALLLHLKLSPPTLRLPSSAELMTDFCGLLRTHIETQHGKNSATSTSMVEFFDALGPEFQGPYVFTALLIDVPNLTGYLLPHVTARATDGLPEDPTKEVKALIATRTKAASLLASALSFLATKGDREAVNQITFTEETRSSSRSSSPSQLVTQASPHLTGETRPSSHQEPQRPCISASP